MKGIVAALFGTVLLASGAVDPPAVAAQDKYWARAELLDRRAVRLHQGATPRQVRVALGDPERRTRWKDVRFGNAVALWDYATSYSGTTAWSAVFVNGCLDSFGAAQQSQTWYRYGRPGWSYPDGDAKDYRFSSGGERVCATSGERGSP